ncbi:hypothetical protein J4732_13675 [Serratia marcescens]|uniref:Uncharacterized protein n=1 Tax=Serratia marcescens TaxID=615 RepID=A0A939NK50_SERMA|nr:hypothetical protein [Serratia marcescens]
MITMRQTQPPAGETMLIIRLYGSPIAIGEEEEPHDDAPDDAEDAAAAGSFAA